MYLASNRNNVSFLPATASYVYIYNTVIYQRLIDSKEKRACDLVPIKIQTRAKNSNKHCISYSTKAVKVAKNSTFLLLV